MQDLFLQYQQSCYKSIGINLRRYRENSKMTQEDFAEKLDCSREFINRVENNKEHIGMSRLIMVSFILNVPIEKFFVDENYKSKE